jgi:hypothetical protein
MTGDQIRTYAREAATSSASLLPPSLSFAFAAGSVELCFALALTQ